MGLLEDARNIQRKDPAARSVLEVILLYPGFHILVYHRIAHWLYEHGHFFLARWVSQHGRHKTGIFPVWRRHLRHAGCYANAYLTSGRE